MYNRRHQARYRGSVLAYLLIPCLGFAAQAAGQSEITILVNPEASALVKHAGRELSLYLGRLFDVETAVAADVSDSAAVVVIIGSAGSALPVQAAVEPDRLKSEGYLIKTVKWRDRPGILLYGKDDKGTLNAAYALVERLYEKLLGYQFADIDFEIPRGAGRLDRLAELTLNEYGSPFYPWRGVYLHNLELGVADLLQMPGGLAESADIWKKWVDWLSRHKGNYIVNWPYNSGFNWWEFVLPKDEILKGLHQYTDEQVSRAIAIRRELIKYANDRGIQVFIGSYIPGGVMVPFTQKVLTQRGLCGRGPLKFSMCLSQPGTFALYRAIVKEVQRTYPEIAGLHYRWWAESGGCFCPECEAARRRAGENWPTMKKFLRALVDTSVEAAPDKKIIVSGFRRASGDVKYAQAMPANVIFECKWGWGGAQDSSFFNDGSDWEPTAEHNVPEDWIKALNRPFLIDHRLTTECSMPIGVDQSWQLQSGISRTAVKADQLPALQGFPLVVVERDPEWVVGIQFHTLLKLNWNPQTEVTEWVRDYFRNHYSADGADALAEALRLDGAGWSHYVVDMNWISGFHFSGWNFNANRYWNLPPHYRKRTLDDLKRLAGDNRRALALWAQAYPTIYPAARARAWDFRHQLAVHYHSYAGTLALMEAFERLRAGEQQKYRAKLGSCLNHYRALLVEFDEKQNKSFGDEMDMNVTIDQEDGARPLILDGIRTIEKALSGETVFTEKTPLPVEQRLRSMKETSQTEYAGKKCWRLAAGPASSGLDCGVRQEYFFADRDFKLDVEYFDAGQPGDRMVIEYDSALGGPVPERGDPYRRVEFKTSGKKGWQRAMIVLTKARFMGRQAGGADLRILARPDRDQYVAAVRLLEMNE